MAAGDFTKQEAAETEDAFKEVFGALPKRKQAEFLGHANDIYMFFAAAKRLCPDENATEVKQDAHVAGGVSRDDDLDD